MTFRYKEGGTTNEEKDIMYINNNGNRNYIRTNSEYIFMVESSEYNLMCYPWDNIVMQTKILMR